jgi:uncharacterized protein YaaN involved in tellurite resistance|tara:strand:- start:7738 stop:8124 length:387 start_codon:yes stop_codon:yes gene_type:complete
MLSLQSVKKFVFKYKLTILAIIISIAIAIYLKREVLESFFKNITEMFEDNQEIAEEWDGKVTSCKLISDEKVKNWCFDGCTNSSEFKKANAECLQAKCKGETGYKKVECLKNNDIVETCISEVASAFC